MKKLWKITSLMTMSALALGLGAVAWNGVSASAESAEALPKYEAALTVDGVTTEYATFVEALSVAENDGIDNAKITLLQDASAARGSDALWIYHNLTVDLAGYTLEQASFPLAKDNKPTLIIEDSSEDKSGRVNAQGGVTFSTVANGTVIINGGTINSLSIATNDNGNATVIVNDGYVETCSLSFLSEGSTGTAELKGGKIAELYAQPGETGTILLKGGQYKWIYGNDSLDPDFLVSDILPEGYKMFGADGRVVDVEVNTLWQQDWATVEEHTVCSYTSYDYTDDGHWVACACGATEGEVTLEAHTSDVVFYNEDGHWNGCVCGYVAEGEAVFAHTLGDWYVIDPATEEKTGIMGRACECGYEETDIIPMIVPVPEETTPAPTPTPTPTPETSAPQTDTPNTSNTPTKKEDKDEGCGSVIGGSLALAVTAIAAVAICKKKEN